VPFHVVRKCVLAGEDAALGIPAPLLFDSIQRLAGRVKRPSSEEGC
jgi:hypothetical protein